MYTGALVSRLYRRLAEGKSEKTCNFQGQWQYAKEMEVLKMNTFCTIPLFNSNISMVKAWENQGGAKFPEGKFPWSLSTSPLSFPCFQIKCKSASEVAQNLNIWSNSHTWVFSTFPRSDSSMCFLSNSDMLCFANIFKDCPTKIYLEIFQQKYI